MKFGGVVFEDLSVDFDFSIDPFFVVFPEKSIASHDESLEKAVALHGELHVARRGGAKMAARSIDGGDHLLVEADHCIGNAGS